MLHKGRYVIWESVAPCLLTWALSMPDVKGAKKIATVKRRDVFLLEPNMLSHRDGLVEPRNQHNVS